MRHCISGAGRAAAATPRDKMRQVHYYDPPQNAERQHSQARVNFQCENMLDKNTGVGARKIHGGAAPRDSPMALLPRAHLTRRRIFFM
ncbi:unnamed protein product [Arctia plantaginis]|uniref:Uncharacterized protein n=1 Tax=Arctia plantaginis TaxID=874455 RepID=A0A8S0ZZM0_ARCPL|nr:unnamed protein product [Arctia plantaginis]